jgi:YfiH family protein
MRILRLEVQGWARFDGLVHGFFGRSGGRSRPPYASLNLSYDNGDDAGIVTRNWCDLKQSIGLHDLTVVTAKQVHGDEILKVSSATGRSAGTADGLMTDAPNVFVGVMAADCVPLLFLEPKRKVVAAVHAGWRGTAAGIAATAIARMTEEYGIDLTALHVAMGPSIGPCCYQVGNEVAEQIGANWEEAVRSAWRPEGAKGWLDLRAVNEAQLVALGVPQPQIRQLGVCTACNVEDFFSYRKEGKTGSQLSFIGWLPSSRVG